MRRSLISSPGPTPSRWQLTHPQQRRRRQGWWRGCGARPEVPRCERRHFYLHRLDVEGKINVEAVVETAILDDLYRD